MTKPQRRIGILGRAAVARCALVAALALAVIAGTQARAAEITWHAQRLADGTELRYARVVPADFDPAKAYPTLLVLPPGSQGEPSVTNVLNAYFATVGPARGWVVVAPAAPAGSSFQGEGAKRVTLFATAIAGALRVEGGKPHLAGVANGGKAAFDAATLGPARFASLTVLPGIPASVELAALKPIASLPVRLFVGSEDAESWRKGSQLTADALRTLGGDVVFETLPSNKSFILTASLPRVFDALEPLRKM